MLSIGLYSTPLEAILWNGMQYLEAVERLRLLLNETEREPDLACYLGSKEGFSMWQQALDPLYYQRPIEERFEIAVKLASSLNGPEVVRLALTRGALPSLAHCITDRIGETILYAIAKTMCDKTYDRYTPLEQEEYEMDSIGMSLN